MLATARPSCTVTVTVSYSYCLITDLPCNLFCVTSVAGHSNHRGLKLIGSIHEETHLCPS